MTRAAGRSNRFPLEPLPAHRDLVSLFLRTFGRLHRWSGRPHLVTWSASGSGAAWYLRMRLRHRGVVVGQGVQVRRLRLPARRTYRHPGRPWPGQNPPSAGPPHGARGGRAPPQAARRPHRPSHRGRRRQRHELPAPLGRSHRATGRGARAYPDEHIPWPVRSPIRLPCVPAEQEQISNTLGTPRREQR